MVEMKGIYQGNLHCELSHGPSGTQISTDAPKDNMGKGEAFSPTDLIGASLGSCILTTMAIVARREGIPFENASFQVQKEMSSNPRKIGSLSVSIKLPAGLSEENQTKLEQVAHGCPVRLSLHPDMKVTLIFLRNGVPRL